MLRTWSSKRGSSSQRSFFELDDDTDNSQTGRRVDSHSPDPSFNSEGAASIAKNMDTTPSPMTYTSCWGLSIPVMPRSSGKSRWGRRVKTSFTEEEPSSLEGDGKHHREHHRDYSPQEASHYFQTVESAALQPPSASAPSPLARLVSPNTVTTTPQRPESSPSVDDSALPFNAGHCSSIFPCTPETRVVKLQGESYTFSISEPEFVQSPAVPQSISPPVTTARTPTVTAKRITQDPPADRIVTPDSSVNERIVDSFLNDSGHSNPPYIPPVQISDTGVAFVPSGVILHELQQVERELHYLEQTQAATSLEDSYQSGGVVVDTTREISQIPNPPPPRSVSPKDTPTDMDDISSLGGDTLGETPTRILVLENGSITETTHNENSTVPIQNKSTRKRRGLFGYCCCCCCCACLPGWVKRAPLALRYAIFVGAALWAIAAGLVAVAILLGKQSKQSSVSSPILTDDWMDGTTTARVDVMSPSPVPSATPSVSIAPSSSTPAPSPSPSSFPSNWPSISSVPTSSTPAPSLSPSTFPPNWLSLEPSGVPTVSKHFTQFPTFYPTEEEPKKKKKGMDRKRRQLFPK